MCLMGLWDGSYWSGRGQMGWGPYCVPGSPEMSLLPGQCGTTKTASQTKSCQRWDLKDGYWRDRTEAHSW